MLNCGISLYPVTDVYASGSRSIVQMGVTSQIGVVARWNGSGWTELGVMTEGSSAAVYSIAVTGAEVYVAGIVLNRRRNTGEGRRQVDGVELVEARLVVR